MWDATCAAAVLVLFSVLALLARQAVARFRLRLVPVPAPVAPTYKSIRRRAARRDQGRRWR